ncbi:MAG: hypothetical protein Q9159_002433 [Coniocarpon cinnabarinum]
MASGQEEDHRGDVRTKSPFGGSWLALPRAKKPHNPLSQDQAHSGKDLDTAKMSEECSYDACKTLFNVTSASHPGLSTAQTALFDVRWRLDSYVERELQDRWEDLLDTLTITGSHSCPYAVTCKEYLQWAWPETAYLSRSMITHIASRQRTQQNNSFKQALIKDTGIALEKSYNKILVVYTGRVSDAIALAQQLCWFTAVFRPLHHQGLPSCSRARIVDNGKWIRIDAQGLAQPRPDFVTDSSTCWMRLFMNSNIAQHFPVKSRDVALMDPQDDPSGIKWATGLEISFAALTAMSGIECYLTIDGGIVLSGYSKCLVPLRGTLGCIWWHMLTTANQSELGMDKVINYLQEHSNWYRTLDTAHLLSARHFLGYCSAANIHLGVEGSNPDLVKASRASDERCGAQIGGFSLGLGSSGLGIFGGNLTVNVKIPRGLRANIPGGSISTSERLERSASNVLLLYDTQTERGYVVPELSALLHCVHSWAGRNERRRRPPFATLATNGGAAALDAIEKGRETPLDHDFLTGEPVRLKDKVQIFLALFDARKKQSYLDHQAQTKSLNFSHDTLLGWDYIELVDMHDLVRKRWQVKQRPQWPAIFQQRPDVLVLFCEDLQPAVQPSLEAGLCDSCTKVTMNAGLLVIANRCALALKSGTNMPGPFRIKGNVPGQNSGLDIPRTDVNFTVHRINLSLADRAKIVYSSVVNG